MKRLYSAKTVTAFYFSLVAIALVSIHFSVYEFTTRDLEHLYANNRLEKIRDYAGRYFQQHPAELVQPRVELHTQGQAQFDRLIQLYFDFEQVPSGFPHPNTLEVNEAVELKSGPGNRAYFVSKSQINVSGEPRLVYLIVDNSLYELSERQLFSLHAKQIVISLCLLILSLYGIVKISNKLTRPISQLALTLTQPPEQGFRPIALDVPVSTIEMAKLIDTFNQYQQRVVASMERERSFTRYASHELRSPLMVMLGAINIIQEVSESEVVDNQCQRLQKATSDMTEFVELLLSLTRSEREQEQPERLVACAEVKEIVQAHTGLLQGKEVSWTLTMPDEIVVNMPASALHILLGNLIKNAFAYTRDGLVEISVLQDRISVTDTGKGVSSLEEARSVEGYGLGLLLVNDICHRYGWRFSLDNHGRGGCQALLERLES